MTTTKDLLDAVKQTAGIESDYALAKELGVYKQLISSYYKGTRKPDNAMCLEIARRTGTPLAKVIAAVEIDAEKDEKRRAEWQKYYKSIGGIAASVALLVFVFVTLIVTPTTVHAMPLLDHATGTLCIMLSAHAIRIAKKVASIARDKHTTALLHYGFSG